MKPITSFNTSGYYAQLFMREEARQEYLEAQSEELARQIEDDCFQSHASEILVNAIGCDALDNIDNAVIKALVLGGEWLNKPLQELLVGIDASKLESELRDYMVA